MRRVLGEYEGSGLIAAGVLSSSGALLLTTFDYWRRSSVKRKPGGARRMVAVESDRHAEPAPEFTFSLANGRRIESSWRFAEAELARLIRVAESA